MSCTSKHLLAGVICGLTSNDPLKTRQTIAMCHTPEASIWFDNWESWIRIWNLGVSWVLKVQQARIAQDWEQAYYLRYFLFNYTQTLLFLKGHRFVQYSHLKFLYIIECNNITWIPHDPHHIIWGSRPTNPQDCHTLSQDEKSRSLLICISSTVRLCATFAAMCNAEIAGSK